jgi:glycosyltransferase involved in cell wall biosynthesis
VKVLFLSRWFPYPADNGSKLRIWNNLQHLAARHEVTLITFGDQRELADADALAKLRQHCARVRAIPYRGFRRSSTRALLGLFSPMPRWLVDTYSNSLARAIAEESRLQSHDVVVASQLEMAPYVLGLRNVPAVLEELEVSVIREGSERARSPLQRQRARLTWLKERSYLRRILPRFGACTVASEPELAHIRQILPNYRNVVVLPNAVSVNSYAGDFGQPLPHSLVFSGALTYYANFEAAEFYLGHVHPLVISAVPQTVLKLTGSTAGVDVECLPRPAGVEFTGYVPDVRPVIAQSWASIVPLRQGGGTRLKILEAMALGTPVISTSKGAEGLDAQHGHNILIADTPEAFAARIVELFESPRLRAHLAEGGRRLVGSKYDARQVGEQLCTLVESVRKAA